MNKAQVVKEVDDSPSENLLLARICKFTRNVGRLKYWWSLFVVIVLILMINLAQKNVPFYFDSGQYWQLGTTFEGESGFSFLHYSNSMRGYLFPFILYSVGKLSQIVKISDQLLYELINPLVYGAFLTILVPTFIERVIKRSVSFYQTLVFACLVIYFWKDYFYFPLSDFPSFIFLFAGVYFAISKKNWMLLLSGIFMGGSFLVRPIYSVVIIPLVIWIGFYWFLELKKSLFGLLLRGLFVVVGLGIVLAPQVAINVTHFGIFSPFVQSQVGQGTDLFTQQLGWGIEVEKYENQVGSSYPVNSVAFLDKQGETILLDSGLKTIPTEFSRAFGPDPDKLISRKEFVKLFLKYPVDFFTIYMRHVFNGLDIVYSTPYIQDIHDTSVGFRITNYSLWFLGLSFILHSIQLKRFIKLPFLILAIFSLPSLLSIPTAIEVRFMLPLFLLMYAMLSFWVLPGIVTGIKSGITNQITKYIIAYVVFVSLCITISATTYNSLQYRMVLFQPQSANKYQSPVVDKIIFEKVQPMITQGNDETFVDSNPISIESNKLYRISLNVNSVGNEISTFYIDFYGGSEFDAPEQDYPLTIIPGDKTYSGIIFSGYKSLPKTVYYRVISISKYPLRISNQKIELLK